LLFNENYELLAGFSVLPFSSLHKGEFSAFLGWRFAFLSSCCLASFHLLDSAKLQTLFSFLSSFILYLSVIECFHGLRCLDSRWHAHGLFSADDDMHGQREAASRCGAAFLLLFRKYKEMEL
jgi:hypothetical protein